MQQVSAPQHAVQVDVERLGYETRVWVRSVVGRWANEPNTYSRRTFSTFRQAA